MKRVRVCLAVALGVALVGALMTSSVSMAAGLPHVVNGKHVMWAAGQGYPAASDQTSANNLIYHGGQVETTPAVYIVYWGTEWQAGFSTSHGGFTYTSQAAQTYIESFFGGVGGSPWAGVQTQYCQGVSIGFSCAGQAGAQFVTNPTSQLKGTWVDPSPVPAEIVNTALGANVADDPIATEAVKAAAHFGYDVNATYFVFTPPNHGALAYGSVYCAYHSESAHTSGHGVRYAFMPYVPEQGAGCGVDSVNSDDAFGHGYFDSFSIVAGHEYAEAVTDPDNQVTIQDGWNDATGSENGDKCAWTGLGNITLGSQHFAVQPLWSNEANAGQGACAMTR